MLDFDRIRSGEHWSPSPIASTSYSYDGWGNLLTKVPVLHRTVEQVRGRKQLMLYKHSRWWRPGVYRENPIDQRRIVHSCSASSVDVLVNTAKGLQPSHRFVNQDLAAIFASGLTDMSAMTFSSDMAYLLQKAEAKLSEPDVDVGLFFGELTNTVRMFTNPIRAFGTAALKFNAKVKKLQRQYPNRRKPTRKGRTEARRFSDSLANAWLTYTYGVLPLMSDIEDVREKLQKGFTKPFGIRKKTSVKRVWQQPNTYGWYSTGIGLRFYTTFQTWGKIEERASVFYYPLPGFGMPAAELGVSIHQLPRLMYNLVPYSFVLNWIVDLDTWLGAISPKLYLAKLGYVQSRISLSVKTTAISSIQNVGYGPECPVSGEHRSSVEKYLRDPVLQPAMIPVVTAPLKNFERSLSAISLLWQKMPRPNTKVFKEL